MLNIRTLGAIGDGTLHTLDERYPTLHQAQHVYPGATSLQQSLDACALQTALNDPRGQAVYLPAGDYMMDAPVSLRNRRGVFVEGEGLASRLVYVGPVTTAILTFSCCQECTLTNLAFHGMGQLNLTGVLLTNGTPDANGVVSTANKLSRLWIDHVATVVGVLHSATDANNDSHVFEDCSFQFDSNGVVVNGSQAHFLRFSRCGFQALSNSSTYGIWCQYGSYVHAVECTFNGMETGIRLDDFFTGPCLAVRCNGENLRRLMTTNWGLNRGGQYNTVVEGCRMAFGPADVSDYVLDFKHDGPFRISDNNFYSVNDKPPLVALRGITMRGIHENNIWTRQTGDWSAGALTYVDGATPSTNVRDFANTYNSPSGSLILP